MYQSLDFVGRLERKGDEPRPQSGMLVRQDNPLEFLKQSLAAQFPSRFVEIKEDDKRAIREEINRVQFPFPVKDFLFYINEETAKKLASSKHPLVSEWGNICTNFYTTDPHNKHVQPETGLVVAKRGGIDGLASFRSLLGNGVWHFVDKDWVVSPGSINYHGRSITRHLLPEALKFWLYKGNNHTGIPPINPPKLSETPFKLLSPIQVAALTGDEQLLEISIAKGARFDDDCNHWHYTPLEMAILGEQTKIIDILFPKMTNINKSKALKLAIEKGSFAIIEKLMNANAPISEEAFKAAKKRDEKLCLYLEMKLDLILKHQTPFEAMVFILKFPEVPIKFLIDIISKSPEVINTIEKPEDGNTILHRLIIEKNITAVKAFLTSLITARSQKKIDKSTFETFVEKKNKLNKTILELALEIMDKDIVSAVLVYANPKRTAYDTQILSLGINLPDIPRQQTDLLLEILSENNCQQQVISTVTQDTNQIAIRLAEQQQGLSHGLMRVAELTAQNHGEISELQQHVNLVLPNPVSNSALPMLTQPELPLEHKTSTVVYSRRNSPVLFAGATANGQQATPVVQKPENPLEELGIIHQEMTALAEEMDRIKSRFTALELRATRLEEKLVAANDKGSSAVIHP